MPSTFTVTVVRPAAWFAIDPTPEASVIVAWVDGTPFTRYEVTASGPAWLDAMVAPGNALS